MSRSTMGFSKMRHLKGSMLFVSTQHMAQISASTNHQERIELQPLNIYMLAGVKNKKNVPTDVTFWMALMHHLFAPNLISDF